jgi:hypothetical protein
MERLGQWQGKRQAQLDEWKRLTKKEGNGLVMTKSGLDMWDPQGQVAAVRSVRPDIATSSRGVGSPCQECCQFAQSRLLVHSAKNLEKSGGFLSRKHKVVVFGKFGLKSCDFMLLTLEKSIYDSLMYVRNLACKLQTSSTTTLFVKLDIAFDSSR